MKCKRCGESEKGNWLHGTTAEDCKGCNAPQDHHAFEPTTTLPRGTKRWFVVIDVADDVEREAADIAMWVELAMGRDHRAGTVEATVFDSADALTEEYGS